MRGRLAFRRVFGQHPHDDVRQWRGHPGRRRRDGVEVALRQHM